jgi:hypothetical protein
MWLNVVGAVLALLTTIAQIVNSLVEKTRESNLKRQGAQEVESKTLEKANEDLKKAIEAREEVDLASAGVPESASLPDDGYRRD